ncbi:MAG: hypothetical protein MI922_16000 [Bacteroidales bacterium]|nr:hypothetical protein [Bacteroidales bacterium]
MKRVGVTLVCLLCSLSVFSKEKYNILYLNSYHLDYYWTQDVTKGLQNIFDTTQNIMVFTEFLDTKRVHDSLYYEMLFEILQYKYSASGIDLILCSDNNALDLVLNNRKNSIFAKPVVFCGIFNVEDYYFPNDSVYGVKEEMLFEGAIESILNMAPGATKIHIVMDRTITSESYKNKIEKIKENVPEKVDITYIRDIDMHRIEEQFSAIKPPEYVYFMGVSYDKDYYRINTIDLAEQIVRHTPGPVFGNLYAFKKVGFVGEACASGIQQGEEAAKLALRVLSIEDRTEIPKLVIPDVKILIDYKVAKKYRLNLKQLPSDVIYLNKPENYFKKYKYEIIVFVIVILILTSIIISLVTNIYKRKAYELRLEKAVEKSEESDKLKSAFLTNMSHEIRTPLNAIMGFANLLDEDNVDEADFKPYINYIITSAR